MFATFRAAISPIALIGFFVFAIGISAGVIIMGYNVAPILRTLGIWIIVAGAVMALGVVAGLVRMVAFRPPLKPGVDVTPGDTPDLWVLVTDLSDTARTSAPVQIRLTHEVNAEVSEDARY